MAVTGVIALVIMLRVAARAPADDRPTLQIDAIKYGLGLFAAAGAAAATRGRRGGGSRPDTYAMGKLVYEQPADTTTP